MLCIAVVGTMELLQEEKPVSYCRTLMEEQGLFSCEPVKVIMGNLLFPLCESLYSNYNWVLY